MLKKYKLISFAFFIALASVFSSCQSSSYPCPAYNSTNKSKSDEDGGMLNTIDVKKDKNGLVKKKKVKKIHMR